MDILIAGRGRAGGHDEIRLSLTAPGSSGVREHYRIRAQAGTDAACPFVLSEYEVEDGQVAGALDLSRKTVTRIIGALEGRSGPHRTVANYEDDDFLIRHDPLRDQFRLQDRAEGEEVLVFDSAPTRLALIEGLKIALHYYDRDAAGSATGAAAPDDRPQLTGPG